MVEKMKRINNPLTIIAIFAALAEINATIALGLISENLQNIFIWFVIGFPTLLVAGFFITLNFNTRVMYSPSDYKDDKSFFDSLYGTTKGKFGIIQEDEQFKYIKQQVTELESQIINNLDNKFQESQSKTITEEDLKKNLDLFKEEIKQLTNTSIRKIENKTTVSTKLKEKLIGFFEFPAFFVLIYGILRYKPGTIKELKKLSDDGRIPSGVDDDVINTLIENEIITGNSKVFSINPEFEDQLKIWGVNNRHIIWRIRNFLRKMDEPDNEMEPGEIREKTKVLASRMKF